MEVIREVSRLQKTVAEYFNLTTQELKAKRRNKTIILPRQIAMYLSRQLTNLSLPEIGHSFGGKDHTTVLHSFKKIDRDLKENKGLRETLDKLITVLKQ